ncbi:MAG: DNA polymerase III subunit delta [Solobacterium sp.]|nr:DNA polymerase III subunit delta [Solobacterium sp.]
MSVYVFTGKDMYRQEERLRKLKEELKVDEDHYVVIDASNKKAFNIDVAMMECDTFSLFDGSDRKLVVLKEPFFLNSATKEADAKASDKKKTKENTEREYRLNVIEQYLKSPNPMTTLVFYCHNFDADTRKKEYKVLQKYGCIINKFDKMKPWDFEKYADQELAKKGYHLTKDARSELLLRVDSDNLLFHNALEKMDLYDKKDLDREDIIHIVPASAEINVFQLSNCFIQKDLAGVIKARDEMRNAGMDVNAMIAMLASRLRSFYNMKKLNENGLYAGQIATRLHANEYAVKKGLENTFGTSSHEILTYLKELAELDQGIKGGIIDPQAGFDAFLIKNGGKHAGNSRTI